MKKIIFFYAIILNCNNVYNCLPYKHYFIFDDQIYHPKKEKLSEVLRMINEDEFLKKNIIGVQVLTNGSLIMANRNYDFQIDFGRTINIEKKFKNYKAFFQKAVLDSTLKKYKKINLKFTKQVVCIK